MKPLRTSAGRAGFTMMELMVTIAIILVLIGLLVVGINGALRIARRSADLQLAAALKTGTEQFKNDLGFLPPLVKDGEPLFAAATGPIENDYPKAGMKSVAVWERDPDVESFLSGWTDEGVRRDDDDKRYSKFSLPYYLMGACDEDNGNGDPIDEEPGALFRQPRRDGLFDPRGRVYEPFYSPRQGSLVRGFADLAEYREHGAVPSGADLSSPPQAKTALVDRKGRAVRYYRWTNRNPTGLEKGEYLCIPQIMQDPLTRGRTDASAADDEPELAGAAYAIVMAGPDGLFGTEDLEDFVELYGESVRDQDLDAVKRKAWRDNIVEVGK